MRAILPCPVGNSASSAGRSSLHVLIVDDDAVSRSAVALQLRLAGCNAAMAHNGQEAVRAWSLTRFDIIFMDCQMPVMDGYAATRAIRELEVENGGARCHIVAMTGSAACWERELCYAAGVDVFLIKPIVPDEVAEVIACATQLKEVQGRDLKAEPPLSLAEALHANDRLNSLPLLPNPSLSSKRPSDSSSLSDLVNATDSHSPFQAASLDMSFLEQLRELPGETGPSLLEEIIDLFLESTPLLLDEAQAAAEKDDVVAYRRAIHTLKGSASNLGGVEVQRTCAAIESTSENDRAAGYRDLSNLAQALDRMYEALRAVPKE